MMRLTNGMVQVQKKKAGFKLDNKNRLENFLSWKFKRNFHFLKVEALSTKKWWPFFTISDNISVRFLCFPFLYPAFIGQKNRTEKN